MRSAKASSARGLPLEDIEEQEADPEDEAQGEDPPPQTNVSGGRPSLAESRTLMRQLHPKKYSDLSLASQQLDKTLFLNISSMLKGHMLSLLQELTGKNARYTFAIIALWRHAELGPSSRRLNAMTDMQSLAYSGEAGK